jgi:hypothetical protein
VRVMGEHFSWLRFSGAFFDLCVASLAGLVLTVLICKLLGVKEMDAYLKRILAPAFGAKA